MKGIAMSKINKLTEFIYKSEQTYDTEVKINNEDVKAYSKKKLDEMFPNKDYKLVGETFESKKLDKENDIGKIELAEKRLFVSESGTHSTLFRKKAAFFAVDGGFIAFLKIRLLPIILLIAVLLGCAGAVVCMGLNKKPVDDNPADTTGIDPNIKPIDSDIITVSGYVKKGEAPIEGAVVKLMKGDTLVATATTDKDGKYLFSEVKNGVYSVVCENDDKKLTRSVVIEGQSGVVEFDYTDSTEKFNAIVKIETPETPAVAVEGIYKEVLANIVPGKTSNIIFKAKKLADDDVPAEDKKMIVESSGELTLTYLDFSVFKEIYTGTTLDSTERITKTGNVFEVAVDYDSSKDVGTYVFRTHDGQLQRFTELKSRPESGFTDGTYYVTASTVFVYTDKFSTYAIGSAQVDHSVKGSDTITYSPKVTVNPKTGVITMLYQHEDSSHNAKVLIYITTKDSQILVSESGIIPTGSKLEKMTLKPEYINQLSVGTYEGTMKIVYLGGENAQTDTNVDIPLTVIIEQ